MSAVREFLETREDVRSSFRATFDKVVLTLYVFSNVLYDYSTLLYNYCKLRMYDYLDIVGFRDFNGVYCLYYTYNGTKYLVPMPRTRGIRPENTILTNYFRNNEDLMHQFMGPRGDWHGHEDFLIQNLKI